jgi:predicted amino acid-binding ACT domain protein
MKEYIITVMAKDRVGIVRDVSTGLSEINGNLTNVSQTVMSGYFTLILSVEMPDERTQLEIRQSIERQGSIGEFEVNVRPFEKTEEDDTRASQRFNLTLRGVNQGGVISRVTKYLAEKSINIDDFYAYAFNGKFVMIVQVSIPNDIDIDKIQSELAQVGREFGMTVHLQHENIFRAISEVRPFMDLNR